MTLAASAVADDLGLDAGATVVVAVSGGADSTALLHLLAEDGRLRLVAWHLDHGLRSEARAEAELVAEQARRLGVALLRATADVRALAAAWGLGIEAAGRRCRYQLLAEAAAACGASVVATAHHRDDQAETVLMHALRGAGDRGLSGIPARRRLADGVELVRPLLSYGRQELHAWLRARGLTWSEDPSNRDRRFRRNELRAHLAAWESALPGCAAALAGAAGAARERHRPHQAAADALWAVRAGPGSIALTTPGPPAAVAAALWCRLCADIGVEPSRARLARIADLAGGAPGRRLDLGGWLLERRTDGLRWSRTYPVAAPAAAVVLAVPGETVCGDLELSVESCAADTTSVDTWRQQLDAAAVVGALHRRLPRAGERWRPLGAPGSQPLVKSLASAGVPAHRRAGTAVVADDRGVVWIPGVRLAERVRVTAATTCCLRLSARLTEG